MDAQLDIYRHSDERLADVYRQAAESELVNPYYPPAVRQRRHDHYAEIAADFERKAAQHTRTAA